MAEVLSSVVFVVATIAFSAGYIVGSTSRTSNGRDPIGEYLYQRRQQLQERYKTTGMDYVEFGDRVTLLEDPGTERIMRDAVDVDRIGPKTALEIARVFDGDYQAYRDANQEAYEEVNGIGENKGSALVARTD